MSGDAEGKSHCTFHSSNAWLAYPETVTLALARCAEALSTCEQRTLSPLGGKEVLKLKNLILCIVMRQGDKALCIDSIDIVLIQERVEVP